MCYKSTFYGVTNSTIATELPFNLEGPLKLKVPLTRPLGPSSLRGKSKFTPHYPLTNHYPSNSSKTLEKFKITTISKKNSSAASIYSIYNTLYDINIGTIYDNISAVT